MLEVTSLNAGYGRIQALNAVSVSIGQGEFVGLLGANNAGKSTTINCLSGLVPAWTGRMAFEGRDFTGWPAHRIVELGIAQVPEGRQLFPEMTVHENLLLGGINSRARPKRAARLDYVLDLFPRLNERLTQMAGTLSGGEQQMLAIGRALIADPKLLILDEPSLGLSPLMVQNIFRILRRLHEEGLTVLLVEQNLNLTLAHASRCYVLERGTVVLEGSSGELKNDPRTRKAYIGL
jgi:branched-chain amino acid transport system ATP-binding protein